MVDKPKIVSLNDKKDEAAVYMMRTRMGTFVGVEQLDSDGNIMGFSSVCEMIMMPDARGMVLAAIMLGDVIEFPNNDEGGDGYVLIELNRNSMYYQRYKEEKRNAGAAAAGIVLPPDITKGA